jgi:hypothetical protein
MGEEAKNTEKDQENTQFTEENATAKEPEKTLTQADVGKIVSDRLARERAKMPSADELKAYGEWKKSQQTEAEKAAEREKALAEAQARSEELKRELFGKPGRCESRRRRFCDLQGCKDGRRF